MTKHSIVVQFYDFADKFWTEDDRTLDPLFALEDELTDALEGSEAGELDGHEIAVDGSDGFLFLFGPDADALFELIEPVLRKSAVTHHADAVLRYGEPDDPGLRQKQIKIDPTTH
jgi:hypothetical protein